jgi:phosphohistidine phosphatase
MTKVIAVLRHAQSAGKQSGQRDYDRLLSTSGEGQARNLGKKLSGDGFQTDLILSSSAVRARQTAGLINEFLRIPDDKIRFKHELYEALMIDWLDNIHELPPELNHVTLVGHNPWLSMLASTFTGTVMDLLPCELAAFEFRTESWNQISDQGKLILNIKTTENVH